MNKPTLDPLPRTGPSPRITRPRNGFILIYRILNKRMNITQDAGELMIANGYASREFDGGRVLIARETSARGQRSEWRKKRSGATGPVVMQLLPVATGRPRHKPGFLV